jgi:ATP-dependent Lon protease
VLLPTYNRKDVKELPEEVKKGLEINYVRYVCIEIGMNIGPR